jgi:addiction module HigA family antidote
MIVGILEGKQSIDTEMATRLSAYFANSVDFWLNLQNHYNAEKAERSGLK